MKKIKNKNKLLIELINNQRIDANSEKKFSLKEITRLCNNITTSIFDENECCLWNGYISNLKNGRDKYINFYYRGNKYALHRLLYLNYVGDLKKSEYLKYTCKNKGICCNINHIKKIYRNNKIPEKNIEIKKNVDTKIEVIDLEKKNKKKLIIVF